MRRWIGISIALVVVWSSFGFIAHWLIDEVGRDCERWRRQGLSAECFAPPVQIIFFVAITFFAATAVLAYLAGRKR